MPHERSCIIFTHAHICQPFTKWLYLFMQLVTGSNHIKYFLFYYLFLVDLVFVTQTVQFVYYLKFPSMSRTNVKNNITYRSDLIFAHFGSLIHDPSRSGWSLMHAKPQNLEFHILDPCVQKHMKKHKTKSHSLHICGPYMRKLKPGTRYEAFCLVNTNSNSGHGSILSC